MKELNNYSNLGEKMENEKADSKNNADEHFGLYSSPYG